MPHRNSPQVQARIYNAQQKKQQQLRSTANGSFVKGAKAGAAVARELIAQGFSDIYEFDSHVLYHLEIIDAEHRVLRGSDTEKSHYDILDEARTALPKELPTDEQFIALAVSAARWADEAWVFHHELTDIYRDDLSDARRAKLSASISQKFPF